MNKVIWKDVKNYSGLYKINNKGEILGLKRNKLLTLNKDNQGYLKVNLCKRGVCKTRRIHQLVVESFLGHIPNKFNGLVINHKNFIKTDNRVNNLELITQRENTNRKHIKSSSRFCGVSWYKNLNKFRSYIKVNGVLKHLGYFDNEEDAYLAYKNEIKND